MAGSHHPLGNVTPLSTSIGGGRRTALWLTSPLLFLLVSMSAATQPTPLHRSGSGNGTSTDGLAPAPLTRSGSRLKTVLVAGLTQGFCQHDNGDWRSTVPLYLAREIWRHGGRVLVWNAHDAQHSPGGMPIDCMFCVPGVVYRKSSFNCAEWFERRSVTADLVIVGGSGDRECTHCLPELEHRPYAQLRDAIDLGKPWMGRRTRTIHIPISGNNKILRNRVAGFDQMLPDSDIVKPTHLADAEEFRAQCASTARGKRLVYVARYHSWKGQMDFLNVVDPALLEGYTIHFFSSKRGADMARRMEKLAAERSIRAVVGQRPLSRPELLQQMCGASGLLHFARHDANPRVLYEGLLAGLPAFITKESHVPRSLAKQPFVQIVHDRGNAKAVNTQLAGYMRMVQERGPALLGQRIAHFVDSTLIEDKALLKICAQLGVCQGQV